MQQTIKTADPLQNLLLISSEERLTGDTAHRKADDHTVQRFREHARNLTGSDVMPRVKYKGRIIEEGVLGQRKLGEAA